MCLCGNRTWRGRGNAYLPCRSSAQRPLRFTRWWSHWPSTVHRAVNGVRRQIAFHGGGGGGVDTCSFFACYCTVACCAVEPADSIGSTSSMYAHGVELSTASVYVCYGPETNERTVQVEECCVAWLKYVQSALDMIDCTSVRSQSSCRERLASPRAERPPNIVCTSRALGGFHIIATAYCPQRVTFIRQEASERTVCSCW